MEGLGLSSFLDIVVPLLLYFLITLTGSFLSDMRKTVTGKDRKMRFNKILIGAVFGAFAMLFIEDFLLPKFSLPQITFVAFIVGSVSFELFGKLSKLDNLIKYFKIYQEVKKNIIIPENTDKPTSKDNDNTDNKEDDS